MPLPQLVPVADLAAALGKDSPYDAVVAVFHSLDSLPPKLSLLGQAAQRLDHTVSQATTLLLSEDLPGGRFILSPTGPLERDQDDVRRIADAAASAMRRARAAGSRRPVFLFGEFPPDEHYTRALDVGLLAALGALWEPLEAREFLGEEDAEPVTQMGFTVPDGVDGDRLARIVVALELSRRLARDITGTEPERMAPGRLAELCQQVFEGTGVTVEVIDDLDELHAGYPLAMAVARASLAVERHHPKVIRLVYQGEGPLEQRLYLAGKGLTYDTGGADLKTDGHMAGMSRDKGGAGAVAGILMAAARLKPRGLRIVAEIGAVRNSIGADSFVSDEILRSHAGTRVRVGNTDAEGRLVLADLLSNLRARALTEQGGEAHLFTVATLTGHAGIAVGPYSIAMDNGPARRLEEAQSLARIGDLWGDPFEVSRLRREDFDFVKPRSKADDVLSCNNLPSSRTPRGHHFPMAFLIRAAGLEDHGRSGARPLAFTHVDIGGSACEGSDWQHGRPTGAPVVAFAARWFQRRI